VAKRVVKLEKFYTKDEVSSFCISKLDFRDYDRIVEPSAGSGSFSKKLDKNKIVSLDILPEDESILQFDFFDYKFDNSLKTIVVGNPPFGRQSSLAFKFINHAASFDCVKTIAFILPKSFKKESSHKKINNFFWLKEEYDLGEKSFCYGIENVDIPCVFQIWERKDVVRIYEKRNLNSFSFVKKKEEPDFSIRRVGFYAGKGFLNCETKNENSHYFIKLNDSGNLEKTINNLNRVVWAHNNTVGSRSISKDEIIDVLENIIK